MATVKKIVKAQSGLCKPSSKRGGGVSCGPKRAYKSEEYKPGKTPRYSKKEQREMDAEAERVVSGRKGKDVGVWHKEWDSDESIPESLKSGYKKKMKKGGKLMKKAKSGASFPDLNKDGKITKADILKGRGVIRNGGALKAVNSSKNPGLAKLPTAVRNKMGYQKNGGKVKMASKKSKK